MSSFDPRDFLHQMLAGRATGRTRQKRGRISPERVTTNTEFIHTEETFPDPGTNRVVTDESSTYHVLSCGCTVSSPNRIKGICPFCARSVRVRLFRIKRYICRDHTMCLHCQAKQHRRQHGGGLFKNLIALVLWPLFDVTDDEQK